MKLRSLSTVAMVLGLCLAGQSGFAADRDVTCTAHTGFKINFTIKDYGSIQELGTPSIYLSNIAIGTNGAMESVHAGLVTGYYYEDVSNGQPPVLMLELTRHLGWPRYGQTSIYRVKTRRTRSVPGEKFNVYEGTGQVDLTGVTWTCLVPPLR